MQTRRVVVVGATLLLAVAMGMSPRLLFGSDQQRAKELIQNTCTGCHWTSMVGFGGQLTDEEIWSIIQHERSFASEHEPGMMGNGESIGPGSGMGGRGGMGGCEGEACGR